MKAFYPNFLAMLQNKEIDMDTDTVEAHLVSDSFEYFDTDVGLSDIFGVLATATVTTPVITAGNFDCDDLVFTGVDPDETLAGVVLSVAITGDPLVCFIGEDSSGTAITQVTNGGDITLTINTGGVYTI